VAELLAELVERRANVLVAGETSSGKTTLLNTLCSLLPPGERVVTIEDAAELRLPGEHVVRLEARPPSTEGLGGATVRDLVRAALRMRPDRLVVGEARGGEAWDLLQALSTGHDGSLATCHAGSPDEALRRLEAMVLQAEVGLPLAAVREQLHGALDAVVLVARRGARRAVVAVAEVAPPEAANGPRVRPLADESQVLGAPARRSRR
jgi:pilus assembly protein CpaF